MKCLPVFFSQAAKKESAPGLKFALIYGSK